jgi:hypothetical protein
MNIFIEIPSIGMIKADCICVIGEVINDQYAIGISGGVNILIREAEYPHQRLMDVLKSIGVSIR